jgi:hypothetical protein
MIQSMIFNRSLIVTLLLAFGIANVVPSAAKPSHTKKYSKSFKNVGKFGMVKADLLRCKILSAKLTMVAEDVFTRTAITEETIEKFGQTVSFPTGDSRTLQLSQILSDAVLIAPTLEGFEPRFRLILNCVDGTSRKILGSRLSPDGALNMDIDGKNVSTLSPLRRKLEGLFPIKE